MNQMHVGSSSLTRTHSIQDGRTGDQALAHRNDVFRPPLYFVFCWIGGALTNPMGGFGFTRMDSRCFVWTSVDSFLLGRLGLQPGPIMPHQI